MFIRVTSVAHLRLCGCCKIPFHDIGRDLADLALIRTILYLAYLAFESHPNHEASYRLVIYEVFPVPHLGSYAPIAIAAFMLMDNILNFLFSQQHIHLRP